MSKKLKLFIVLLIAIISILLFYLNESAKEKNSYLNLNELVFYGEFHQYLSNLYLITETMELYNEEFSEEEVELYFQALNNTLSNINHLVGTLNYLSSNLYGDKVATHFLQSLRPTNTKLEKVDYKQKKHEVTNILKRSLFELEALSEYENVTTEQGIIDITKAFNHLEKKLESILSEH
ncbi:hypothetical protein [Alkalihalobacterium elongatum]|uniref:hypothetical protein n=1 Tax=Alkalihalobacterium elongatum TaxID=2675466 RepID=UPI001C1F7904|nr:hypothetical protein [Alkalihalobacterium elongatum]